MEIILPNNKKIGDKNPCFIIAEAGVNHNGDKDMAMELVRVAARAGADAIKFQTFITENIILKNAPKAEYHIKTTGKDDELSWYKLLKSQEISPQLHKELIKECKKENILFMSTPYDYESVDLLCDLGIPILKVASTDANNIAYLQYMASKQMPIILSTAMCELGEVKKSVEAIKEINEQLVLLQCTGNYPAPLSDANLLSMNEMKNIFNVIVGYSDHVEDDICAISAIALGAKVYEKHFTLDQNLPGPDHNASIEPDVLCSLIEKIRKTERSLGDGNKRVMNSEIVNRKKLRKYMIASKPIKKGDIFNSDNIAVKRTGGAGIVADKYYDVVGKVAKTDISLEQPITMESIN